MQTYADMSIAPRDGSEIVVFNPVTGEYVSRATNVNGSEEWPLFNWGGHEGVWYPAPHGWRPIEASNGHQGV